jgi:acetolactate decarboxylase
MLRIEQEFIQALHALRHHRQHSRDKSLHEVYQSSTINALLEGVYDGTMTYGRLREHGDFGIGTFNALDGEMIGFDGHFWQITGDGRVYPVPDEYQTPFATVLFFQPHIQRVLDDPIDYSELRTLLDNTVSSMNLFYAIRIDGHFRHLRTRSVPRQTKPYPPLTAVTKDQPVFELNEIAGTLAGFRFPQFAEGMNVPGYHLHFLSDDRSAGGHVQSFDLAHGRLAIDDTPNFHIELPTDASFLSAELGGERTGDIEQVEK